MGFSTIGAGVILIVGALFIGTMILNASFDAQRTVMRGLEEEKATRALQRESDAAITAAEQVAEELRIWVKNQGGTTLDASRVNVIVNGTWANPLIQERTVDGRNSDVWAPQQVLFLRLDMGPGTVERAYIVLETGTGLGWTPPA